MMPTIRQGDIFKEKLDIQKMKVLKVRALLNRLESESKRQDSSARLEEFLNWGFWMARLQNIEIVAFGSAQQEVI